MVPDEGRPLVARSPTPSSTPPAGHVPAHGAGGDAEAELQEQFRPLPLGWRNHERTGRPRPPGPTLSRAARHDGAPPARLEGIPGASGGSRNVYRGAPVGPPHCSVVVAGPLAVNFAAISLSVAM